MCLAIQFQYLSQKDPGVMYQSLAWPQDPQYLMNIYREKVVQCLVLGKYTKSVPYSVEALLLCFTIEHFQNKDMQAGCVCKMLNFIVPLREQMREFKGPTGV